MMLSSQQIRAARALLGLSKKQLSSMTGYDSSVIKMAENDTSERDFSLINKLDETFKNEGIEFIKDGESGGGPGVRLRMPVTPCRGIRPQDLNSTNDG